ncbi:MAG: hypothetical protein WCS43_09300 [Verrucomicrobiota bacterium]
MSARHSMVHPVSRVLPAGLGCLWMLGVLFRTPSQAAGVLLPTQSDGFGTTMPGQPSGFPGAQTTGHSISDLGNSLLQGLKLTTNFSTTYNSNISPNQNVNDDSDKDDFIMSLGGKLEYLSKSSDFTFGGNYRGNYNQYFNHSDLSGYNQGGGLIFNYNGGRFSISGAVGMSVDQGNNSNYSSAFVKQTTVNSSLTARYRLSPKTSLQGTFSQVYTSATGGYSDTTSLSFDASALWKYSPITEFGPGARYTYRSGSTQLDRTSIGPTLNLNYKLSEKVMLNSRVGVDFASYSDGTSADPTISASLGLNYQASKLWGMDFSMYRDTQADPATAGAYTEVTSLRLGYHHKIRRALWNIGASYQISNSIRPGGSSGGDIPERDFLTFDTSLSMLTFANTTTASVFLQFNEQRGGTMGTWNSVQTGFSLSRSF